MQMTIAAIRLRPYLCGGECIIAWGQVSGKRAKRGFLKVQGF
ncbi:hypothetical protein BSS2_I1620 [Brucella suis bv. 1 str. S2]|uniref:Uncharacterized protein n=4 Tax=Brucella TaxID=234 RepID=Q2YRG5_BRUA2|nr:hypothetical protein BR1674 [Brucella suis 1330]AAX74978.1 hypothetical protein BruAb1_1659 [Brucella abortus bv. 1 str. 9-941]ACU48646.1 hypothetical protein BMI_I1695 [Brucella microti CCM 4915]AEK54972.1 hypothetical protein BPI_I1736 [Brucella pinnipedialis B2/94]AEU06661.1 hypothetical protein BSVBI22_A1670 [Brucella suis VBI22]AHN47269.1 hypothetical protein BSS2_I1620 [Brucella suis bv. 1 str. S2]EFM56594.1 Hypothetical protein BIBO1_1327 [Brucella inopinata BO1]EFM59911.1 Hypothet